MILVVLSYLYTFCIALFPFLQLSRITDVLIHYAWLLYKLVVVILKLLPPYWNIATIADDDQLVRCSSSAYTSMHVYIHIYGIHTNDSYWCHAILS
jgi:hypothetical protein